MRSLRTILVATAPCLLLAACDIPTDVPILEQRWVIPVEESALGVDELLPSGVTLAGSNFSVNVDPVSAGESIGVLCPACPDSGGVPVPVPAFSGSFSAIVDIPGFPTDNILNCMVPYAILQGAAFSGIT